MRSSVSVFMWNQVIVRLSILLDTMSGSITIMVSFNDHAATFSVQDTGIGIPAAGEESMRVEDCHTADASL